MDVLLYQFPGACSRVTMTALEEIGAPFEDRCINFRSEEQKAPAFLAVNPKAKIPVMVVDGRTMTENAAMLWYLHKRHPDAFLLPQSDDPATDTQGLIDLVWCASTIHPIVRQVRNPFKVTVGETDGVKQDGLQKMAQECGRITDRLSARWWYGDDWSIIDTYIYWAYSTAVKGGFDLSPFPRLIDHAAQVRDRPSFQRALRREERAVEQLGLIGVEL